MNFCNEIVPKNLTHRQHRRYPAGCIYHALAASQQHGRIATWKVPLPQRHCPASHEAKTKSKFFFGFFCRPVSQVCVCVPTRTPHRPPSTQPGKQKALPMPFSRDKKASGFDLPQGRSSAADWTGNCAPHFGMFYGSAIEFPSILADR